MAPDTVPFLRDPAFRQLLQDIRQTNNWTNWFYILRSWLIVAVALTGAVAGLEYVLLSGIGWGWVIPIVIVSAIFVGAGQHHLGVLGHEGSHRSLFRNRWLNEIASDWLCMYPIFSTTYMYRLQHLAHHQFVNDPDRDPNVVQMRVTNTWPAGPLRPRQVLGYVLGLLTPKRLFGFLTVRIQANAFSTHKDVYRDSGTPAPSWPKKLGALCVVGQLVLNIALVYHGDLSLLAIGPAAFFIASFVFFSLAPGWCFHRSRVKPDMSMRATTLSRLAYYFLMFHGLAWVSVLTGRPALWYFVALWVLPLLTMFQLFMLLRQFVQHANGGRGRLSNTRVFLRPMTMNFFLLPIGQDYHLPHHLFASIPHYRLRQLHEALLRYSDYRVSAIEVDGVTRTPAESGHHSLLTVLGAEAERDIDGTFIDSSVLEEHDVSEREAIQAEEAASAR
jgi:fatty acid desaturase